MVTVAMKIPGYDMSGGVLQAQQCIEIWHKYLVSPNIYMDHER